MVSGVRQNGPLKIRSLLILVFAGIVISCTTSRKPYYLLGEDEIFVTRKYIGNYLDYRHTGPTTFDGPNIIWIKTSMDNTYGKISAYSKKCEFSVGDKIYLKRTYYTPGTISGYWGYQVENDSSVYYRATDYQYDKKVLIQSWFR
jgi:hypothetical protein